MRLVTRTHTSDFSDDQAALTAANRLEILELKNRRILLPGILTTKALISVYRYTG